MARRIMAAAVLMLVVACGGDGAVDARPHIILITSDTLRADHLSVNGYPRETSPSIDAFAGEAWHFTDAITVIPKTGPAFATMFTGLHPQQHGVRSNFEAIPETVPVLAERLADAGYRTAAFVGNPALRSGKGYARGFEHYVLFDGRRAEGVLSVNEAFLAWAQNAWDRPSFVWIHYMDPHGPYTPPAEVERLFIDDALANSDERVPLGPESAVGGNPNKVLGAIPAYQVRDGEDRPTVYVARYDAEIRHMDSAFAAVIEFLERRGLYDRAAVLLSSDHGESLGEHDFYFEHGWFAYEPGLRIPLMIKQPGQTERRVVDRSVSILDLFPTLLSLAGSAAEGVAGIDLLAPLATREPILIENSDRYPDKYHGVRDSRWKYLRRVADGAEELYDLIQDAGEVDNLAKREPEQLRLLRGVCEKALASVRETALPPATGLPDDPRTIERLRSLGYLD
jgi:arylsulfatase A-like enzyme